MKILLAIDHDEMETYIAGIEGVSTVTVVKTKGEIIKQLESIKPDVIFIAHDLPGEGDMQDVIRMTTACKNARCRIVYIYGDDDREREDYESFLNNCGVNVVLVGSEITSVTIDMALFGAIGSLSGMERTRSPLKKGGSMLKRMKRLFHKAPTGQYKHSFPKAGSKAVVSFISNHTTGKTYTAWNLMHSLAEKGFSCSLINMDRGYSANHYFNPDRRYHELLNYIITRNEHHSILEKCCKMGKQSIISGKPGDTEEIGREDFEKLLYHVRSRSDITLLDTRTGICDTTQSAIKHSSLDVLVFDCNPHHYLMNLKMLEALKEDFVPEKTVALINNADIRSPDFKRVYNDLSRSFIPFTGIYIAADERGKYAEDMDKLSGFICSW